MPVRAPDAYLPIAIRSILDQTYTAFELLLVCKNEYQSAGHAIPTDNRIRILTRDEPDLVSALNTGIRGARGDYIARMDADDIALPERLDCQLAYLEENPAVKIAGAHVELFNAEGELQAGMQHYQSWLSSITKPDQVKQNIFVESPLPHPTFFGRAAVFRELRYRDCTWAEDYDFLLRAHLLNYPMGKPAPVLLRWREHAQRLTRVSERYSTHNFIHARAWALAQQYSKRSILICGLGNNAVTLHDALKKNGMNVNGFIEHDDARPRTSRRSLPVTTYSQFLQSQTNDLVVSAVSARGAREKIRALFVRHGMIEGEDFVIAA